MLLVCCLLPIQGLWEQIFQLLKQFINITTVPYKITKWVTLSIVQQVYYTQQVADINDNCSFVVKYNVRCHQEWITNRVIPNQ